MLTLNVSLKKLKDAQAIQKNLQQQKFRYSVTGTWAFDYMEDKHVLYPQEDYCIIQVDREAWRTAYIILYLMYLTKFL